MEPKINRNAVENLKKPKAAAGDKINNFCSKSKNLPRHSNYGRHGQIGQRCMLWLRNNNYQVDATGARPKNKVIDHIERLVQINGISWNVHERAASVGFAYLMQTTKSPYMSMLFTWNSDLDSMRINTHMSQTEQEVDFNQSDPNIEKLFLVEKRNGKIQYYDIRKGKKVPFRHLS